MRRRLLALSFALLAALVVLRIADPWPVKVMRDTYFDALQRILPRAYVPEPVRVVLIDDASLKAFGQWPWARSRLAELNSRLAELGAVAVVYDILFSEPDRLSPSRLLEDPTVHAALGSASLGRLQNLDYDAAFGQAMSDVPTVLSIADAGDGGVPPPTPKAGLVAVGNDPTGALFSLRSATPVLPVLDAAAAGRGAVNVDPTGGGDVIRAVPLLWRSAAGIQPSLSLEALRVAMGQKTVVLFGAKDGTGLSGVRVGQVIVPTTREGLVYLHYRQSRPDDFISALKVLQGGADPGLQTALQGSVVFVGASASGLTDIRTTVLGEQVPGVAIHAQMLEQMLTGTFLRRSDTIAGIEILALVAVGAVVLSTMSIAGPLVALFAAGAAGAVTLGASWYAYARLGLLFDASFPLLGGFAAFSGVAMFRFVVADRERRAIRRSFSRYVSPEVLGELDRRGHKLALGGEVREITVMFSDIRNFTPLSETMPAPALVAMLNTLFTDLSAEILGTSGTIDKYIGDEIMAFWNAPLATAGHERKACLAALGMRAALDRFNRDRAAQGLAPIEIAVGLDAGVACVGNIGSSDRFNYTAIGETVNVAARTQTACRRVGCDILVTEAVARAASGLAFLPAGQIALKGVSDRIAVCILLGGEAVAASPGYAELATAHRALVADIATDPPDMSRLAAVRRLAVAVEPRLAAVYDALPGRLADFLGQGQTPAAP